MTTIVEHLAEYASREQTAPLAEEVRHHAKRALIDWFAALLPGAVLPPATLLGEALADEINHRAGHGNAIVYGSFRRASLRAAALINATASHTIEFDDIFRDAVYHPGCPVIGAALAAAQARGADGETLLRGIVIGYEISTRIGVAVQPSHYQYLAHHRNHRHLRRSGRSRRRAEAGCAPGLRTRWPMPAPSRPPCSRHFAPTPCRSRCMPGTPPTPAPWRRSRRSGA